MTQLGFHNSLSDARMGRGDKLHARNRHALIAKLKIPSLWLRLAMEIKTVREELFDYLLSGVSGAKFEALAKGLFKIQYDENFTPLGGIHDGGADGFLSSSVYQGEGDVTSFAQFSITAAATADAKITGTLNALNKAGRQPAVLIYATSAKLPKQDLIARKVFTTYKVLLQIRDYEWIRSIVNTSRPANNLFHEIFAHEINALAGAAVPLHGAINEYVKDPSVFAYLDHELNERFAKDSLYDPIADALILWVLRETDPDATPPKLIPRSEIASRISDIFPTAKTVLLPRLSLRLEQLSNKTSTGVERLRHYRKTDSFSLPFESREALASASATEQGLQKAFMLDIHKRVTEFISSPPTANTISRTVELVFSTVHNYFVEQGLVLAAFLNQKLDSLLISDQVLEDDLARSIASMPNLKKGDITPEVLAKALHVLRGVFYEPTNTERDYLRYLSRTSLLFNTLHSSPRVIEYFNTMAGNFNLLVGTDLLIKSIAEMYLEEPQRQVSNLLRLAAEMGASLILTEPTLDEVFTHIHAADLEYRNHYFEREPYLTRDVIAQCDRILIRTYFHSKSMKDGPNSWSHFMSSILDYNALKSKSDKARNDLMHFLTQRYKMKWLPTEELKEGVNLEQVQTLSDKLAKNRPQKNEELSYNDALMAHAVYAQRNKRKESAVHDGLGMRTWWLTKETAVLSHTAPLVMQNVNVPYIMRPEFLLNFVVLAPKAAEVRRKFKELLPTTVGLQLGHHLSSAAMDRMLASVESWKQYPPERVSVLLADKANLLMQDRLKQYTERIQ